MGTLQNLVSVLLLRLVDEALGRLPEGEALLKALNVLVLKILENCNRCAHCKSTHVNWHQGVRSDLGNTILALSSCSPGILLLHPH